MWSGGAGVWLGGLGRRREARRVRKRLWAVENQLNLLKQQTQRAEADHHAAGRAVAVQGVAD